MEEHPSYEPSELANAQDDLPPEEVEAARRRSRINALVLGLVFLLLTVAPHPWNLYAPILFLVPFLYSLVSRMRRIPGSSQMAQPQRMNAPVQEPYSCTPSDPKDLRRYKPIG